MRKIVVNFQINHKKRIYLNKTAVFSLNLSSNFETEKPDGCNSVTNYISAKQTYCFL